MENLMIANGQLVIGGSVVVIAVLAVIRAVYATFSR